MSAEAWSSAAQGRRGLFPGKGDSKCRRGVVDRKRQDFVAQMKLSTPLGCHLPSPESKLRDSSSLSPAASSPPRPRPRPRRPARSAAEDASKSGRATGRGRRRSGSGVHPVCNDLKKLTHDGDCGAASAAAPSGGCGGSSSWGASRGSSSASATAAAGTAGGEGASRSRSEASPKLCSSSHARMRLARRGPSFFGSPRASAMALESESSAASAGLARRR
mmetsp:Transcript_111576/g.356154  ORF Transcript_111576/g.356154 Transcript_111576/m.356154 type:complete len:219 (+) Transcript_111576:261-917(+)